MIRNVLGAIGGLAALMLMVGCGGGGGTDGGPDGIMTPDAVGFDTIVPQDVPGVDTPTGMDVQIVRDMPTNMTPDMPVLNTSTVGDPCNTGSMQGACGSDPNAQCLFFNDPNACPQGMTCNGVCVLAGCTPGPQGGPGNCGAGFECTQVSQTSAACIETCTPQPGGNDCGDASVVCSPFGGICIGGCQVDVECGEGNYCNTDYGVCLSSGTANPEAAVGGPCTADAECTQNGACLPDQIGFPGGYCSVLQCQFDSTTFACPDGSTCVPIPQGNLSLCLQNCTMGGTDCRQGYQCMQVAQGVNVCFPMQQ